MVRKEKITLMDMGPWDGGITVKLDRWPKEDPPSMRELFKDFLEKEIEVTITKNKLCFVVQTKG